MTIAMSTKKVVQMWVQVLSLLILLPATASAAYPPQLPDGWSDAYAYVNGARIHYYHAVPNPGKQVIVMVHGATDIGLFWAGTAEALQEDYDIYMLDARGHGMSDPITVDDDGDTLIKDVAEFTRVMNFEKPILMGHSMGAATVMRVGAEYTDLAKGVVMVDPGLPRTGGAPRAAPGSGAAQGAGQPDTDAEESRFTFSMNGAPETLVAQNNYDYDELVALCLDSRHPEWGERGCQYWALSEKQYHGPYSDGMFAVMSGSMRTGDSLAQIPVPSLILKADTSPEGRQANEEAVSEMPRVKLVHVDGAGHNVHLDKPERTEELLREFFSTL